MRHFLVLLLLFLATFLQCLFIFRGGGGFLQCRHFTLRMFVLHFGHLEFVTWRRPMLAWLYCRGDQPHPARL